MTTLQSLSIAKVLSCALIAGLVLGFLLPLVAVDIPSYGDGAEMVMAALTGSLVHPPGFPVFSHLNEWLYAFLGGAPYATVASFSVFEHTVAALILFWVLSYWLKSLWLAAGLTLSVALAPSAIKIATDAEVFAFHHLMMAILIWVALSVYRKPTLYKVMGFGFVFGIAGAHHPLAIFWMPLAFLPLIKDRKEIFKQSFAFVLFGCIGLCPYFLLFERYDAAPVWAFGHVTTFSELYHHVMRTTYGTLKLSGNFTGEVTSLLSPFLIETLKTAPLLLILFGYGLWKSYKEKNTSRLLLCFVFILHLLFLILARMPNTDVSIELGTRFYSSVLLALMLSAVPGCFYFLADKAKIWTFVLVAGLLGPTFVALPHALERAQWAEDRIARDFVDATFQALPEKAVFIAQHDAESFGMLYDQAVSGIRRDVQIVVEGRLSTSWYRQQLREQMPALEGRLLQKSETLLQLMSIAKNKGLRVFTSFPISVSSRFAMRPLGVLWEVYERERVPDNAQVVATMLRNCTSVVQNFKAPAHAGAASFSILNNLSGGYLALVQTLNKPGFDPAQLKNGIDALVKGQGFAELRNACRAYEKQAQKNLIVPGQANETKAALPQ